MCRACLAQSRPECSLILFQALHKRILNPAKQCDFDTTQTQQALHERILNLAKQCDFDTSSLNFKPGSSLVEMQHLKFALSSLGSGEPGASGTIGGSVAENVGIAVSAETADPLALSSGGSVARRAGSNVADPLALAMSPWRAGTDAQHGGKGSDAASVAPTPHSPVADATCHSHTTAGMAKNGNARERSTKLAPPPRDPRRYPAWWQGAWKRGKHRAMRAVTDVALAASHSAPRPPHHFSMQQPAAEAGGGGNGGGGGGSSSGSAGWRMDTRELQGGLMVFGEVFKGRAGLKSRLSLEDDCEDEVDEDEEPANLEIFEMVTGGYMYMYISTHTTHTQTHTHT